MEITEKDLLDKITKFGETEVILFGVKNSLMDKKLTILLSPFNEPEILLYDRGIIFKRFNFSDHKLAVITFNAL